MTEPERAALDHIRQVVDSVLGVPNIPDTLPPDSNASTPDTLPPDTNASITDTLPPDTNASIPDTLPSDSSTPTPDPLPPDIDASILPVPYFSQLEAATDQFISDSGAATGAMLVQSYTDQTITPAEFYKQTGQVGDAALSFEQISNTLGAKGVPVELRSGLKLADLSLILFSGRPVIALVQQMVLQAAGLTPEKIDGPHYLVVVGMDVEQAFVHDPLRRDATGQSQGIPWLIFYQAWTQAEGYERAILVPRLQLVRRVCVTADPLNVYSQPDASAMLAGTVNQGDLFEIKTQANGWGKIGEDRWISLSDTADI
jgi:hypothetical protein